MSKKKKTPEMAIISGNMRVNIQNIIVMKSRNNLPEDA